MLEAYPSISKAEFAKACEALEARCCDRLEDTRWRSVCWQLDELCIFQTSSTPSSRPADSTVRVEETDGDNPVPLVESGDVESIHRRPGRDESRPDINFSIVLSLTYRVPVLWFTIAATPTHRVGLDDIYSTVVENSLSHGLRQTGVIGGISMAHHPVSDRPAFFVHPCNTPEALLAVHDGSNLDPFTYLILWLGIIGPAVGLHVPVEILHK